MSEPQPTEPKQFPCPRCGTDIIVGVTQCPRCQVALPPEGLDPPGEYDWVKFLLVVLVLSFATYYGLQMWRQHQLREHEGPPGQMETLHPDK